MIPGLRALLDHSMLDQLEFVRVSVNTFDLGAAWGVIVEYLGPLQLPGKQQVTAQVAGSLHPHSRL